MPGIQYPPLSRIAEYFPQFALAAAEGVPMLPNTRVLSTTFSSTATGKPQPASFSEPFGTIGIFAGCVESIDPTGSPFSGNPLKSMSDYFQAKGATGIAFSLYIQSHEGWQFVPVPDLTPLQMIPDLLNPSAGTWACDLPDNVKAFFSIQAPPPGGTDAVPITPWIAMVFLQLVGDWDCFRCLPRKEARRRLRDDHGIVCGGGPIIIPQPAPPPAPPRSGA